MLNHVMVTCSDGLLLVVDRPRLKSKVELLVQSILGECLYRPGNEFLIDVALTGLHPVDLAY